MATVRQFAPAKVNLYLHVIGRRPDGYHRVDSLVAFADVGDVVTAESDRELSLRIVGPYAGELSSDDDNLVLKAAHALRAAAGVHRGARLTLRKNLPVASGIGGGSADAAASLRALIRLWRLKVKPGVMAGIARGLGADVPACLASRAAFATGIGERLTSAPGLPALSAVLVSPGLALATPDVFKARRGLFGSVRPFAPALLDGPALVTLLAARRNDLTEAAIRLQPAIAEVLRDLAATDCRLARMSGSGATCYGIFSSDAAARRAARAIAASQPRWWVKATRLGSPNLD
ncbi:MAG: 4-(cytidine 5'-diphospho)-2-C-methyl-D-erythritol kinase [Alphaproteobacteria bacterium]|nr:4-(cytidine 5'-diphospho)-2-C-methyl-D-erythritol kinase [Alphaproteobacteria bacterium]